MAVNDPKYYRERARQEREMAAQAVSPSAKVAHEALAKRYEQAANGEPVKLNIVERG